MWPLRAVPGSPSRTPLSGFRGEGTFGLLVSFTETETGSEWQNSAETGPPTEIPG